MIKKNAPTLMVVVFFVSGLSSLIYQTAWQRILTLYYSVENISTTLIVSVYMMGLGIGAILGGFLTEKIKNKLAFYIIIELLIGLFGFISIPLLEVIGKYTSGSNYLVSFTGMFLFLSIPTILMGMTLPLLTKIYNGHVKNFFKTLSYLYFINTLGAAVGCLVSSYVIISFFGLDSSIYFAVLLNLFIALSVWIFKNKLNKQTQFAETQLGEQETELPDEGTFKNARLVFMIVFVTGFIAVGYEIIWFRLIGTIVKASPYAFSSILFTYLIGIALGSYLMKGYLKRYPTRSRKNLFFFFQFYIALYVLISVIIYLFLILNVSVMTALNDGSFANMEHPYASLPRTDSVVHFLKDLFKTFDVFLWPFAFIFIPTLLMGASFPLITSLAFKNKNAAGVVGKVYFFNVLGNVTGALVTGLIFLDVLGSEKSLLILSLGGLMFILFVSGGRRYQLRNKVIALATMIVIAVQLFPEKHDLYSSIHPRNLYHPSEKKIITEGVDGLIATYSYQNYLRTYINGMSHGGRPLPIFYYEAIETLSYKANPDSVLVIGFGTGSTVETVLKVDSKPNIKLVELSKALIENLKQVDYLKKDLENPQMNIEYADGRKFLLNSIEKFDAVFMDPLRTTTSFSNNLYSAEFFSLIKDHMQKDGVLMVWTDEHNIVPKTLCSVFPIVYKYSFFCIASLQELKADSNAKYALFEKFTKEDRQALVVIDSMEKKPMNREQILKQTKTYPINTDYKPRTEYYIGMKRWE